MRKNINMNLKGIAATSSDSVLVKMVTIGEVVGKRPDARTTF